MGVGVQENGAPRAMDADALRSAPPGAQRDPLAAVAWGAILAAACTAEAACGSAPALGVPLGAVCASLGAFAPSALGNFTPTGGALPLGVFAPTGSVLGAPLGAVGASLSTCAPLGAVGASLGTFAPTALDDLAPAGGALGAVGASLGAFSLTVLGHFASTGGTPGFAVVRLALRQAARCPRRARRRRRARCRHLRARCRRWAQLSP